MSDSGRCRILLVEDEPDVQSMMRLILSGIEWDLQILADGQEAIDAREEEEFDLILMDLQMRGMDGLSATRLIRSREDENQHIPIIALTANALPQARSDCLQAGMDEVLIKPLQAQTLRDMIKAYRS
jgi:CheY-like chemotaxis protein